MSRTHKRKRTGKRDYNSPLRQQRHAETRERIVTAGAGIVHGLPAWDWRTLTFAAVGEQAGVSRRTVHRHFASERELHDAILQRLVQESGIRLQDLELGNFSATVRQMLQYLASFAVKPAVVIDPSFVGLEQRRRDALLAAVERAAPNWTSAEHHTVAALLDVFWNPLLYERLLAAWRLDPKRAARAVSWLIELIEDAIRRGRKPS